MFFQSLTELWVMDGHGVYVWTCYAVTFAVLIGLVVYPVRKKKSLMKGIKQRLAHEAVSEVSG